MKSFERVVHICALHAKKHTIFILKKLNRTSVFSGS